MDAETLELLKKYIEAKIEERITSAFGRDSLYEVIQLNDVERVLDHHVKESGHGS